MKKQHAMDLVFGLVLFALFTGLILMVLMSGVGAYRGVERSMQANFDQRTAVSYLATKIRHYDTTGGVSVEPFGELEALRLRERIDEVDYSTWVYALDGQLMELFVEDGNDLEPEAGSPVLAVGDLYLLQEDSSISLTCTGTDGKISTLRLCLRAEQEDGQ